MYPYEDDYYIYYQPTLMQSLKYSFSQINVAKILENTQKTLYTANQIIPIINQLRPVISNAKTAFRVAKAVKEI
ncbi:MAG: hypothetical protein LUH02_00405 [Erysipelotrichaceae bacterium]|nr:hypothetical protein [Erysipelotrichaceae bacterium]